MVDDVRLIKIDAVLRRPGAEFLMGKLLDNNLLALGVHSKVRELLSSMGRDLAQIEEQEPEPSLGNGGLGRLAA